MIKEVMALNCFIAAICNILITNANNATFHKVFAI